MFVLGLKLIKHLITTGDMDETLTASQSEPAPSSATASDRSQSDTDTGGIKVLPLMDITFVQYIKL